MRIRRVCKGDHRRIARSNFHQDIRRKEVFEDADWSVVRVVERDRPGDSIALQISRSRIRPARSQYEAGRFIDLGGPGQQKG